MTVFLVTRLRNGGRRSRRYATLDTAKTAAAKAIAQPHAFKAVWIYDLHTGDELFHELIEEE